MAPADGGTDVEAAPPEPRRGEPGRPRSSVPSANRRHVGKNPVLSRTAAITSRRPSWPPRRPVVPTAAPAPPSGCKIASRSAQGQRAPRRRALPRPGPRRLDPPVPVWIVRQRCRRSRKRPSRSPRRSRSRPCRGRRRGNPAGLRRRFPGTARPSPTCCRARPSWPSVAWEHGLLRGLEHPGLPRVIASFAEDNFEYLIEEVPDGPRAVGRLGRPGIRLRAALRLAGAGRRGAAPPAPVQRRSWKGFGPTSSSWRRTAGAADRPVRPAAAAAACRRSDPRHAVHRPRADGRPRPGRRPRRPLQLRRHDLRPARRPRTD